MRTRIIIVALATTALPTAQAAATTLREALVQVYRGNPNLTGARAELRATDEGVPIARAPGLPQLSATGNYQEFAVRSSNDFTSPRRAASAGLALTVPLYSGGEVRNGIRAANERVAAGRAGLRSTEANVFVDTVSAYMNVIRDEAIVELNRGNVRVLETNLQASRDRFEVGDLTRTDVAQSQARLAVAQSQLQSARAQLDASRETYLRIVGSAPDRLDAPPPLPTFPATPDDAVDVAVANNPDLDASRAQSRAAAYDVRVAESLRLPRIGASANGDYANYLGTLGSGSGSAAGAFSQSQKSATIAVGVTVPLFQGGLPGARVRQAQAIQSLRLEQATAVERDVVAQARTNYSLWTAAQAVITSSETAVAANELALEGVRAENSVGTRNVLDVLNAEQELLNSRSQLVSARRDAYVAGFALLASLGRAEAKDLGLDGGPLYDPVANYTRVAHSINDWAKDPTPQPIAATTVGVPSASTVDQNKAATAPRNELDKPGATTSPTAAPATSPALTPDARPPVAPSRTQPPGTQSHQ